MKKAVMLFANGYEEVEALMTVDLLKRAGVDIRLVSINDEMTVTGSHGISVVMDTKLSHIQLKEEDAIIIPGGMPGTMNLGVDVAVTGALKQMNRVGKIVAAICAAPSVLGKCGILEGKRATCYPGFEDQLLGAEVVKEKAVTDGLAHITRIGDGEAVVTENLLHLFRPDGILAGIFHEVDLPFTAEP